MSGVIAWMAAEAEEGLVPLRRFDDEEFPGSRERNSSPQGAQSGTEGIVPRPTIAAIAGEYEDFQSEAERLARRIYRRRTVAMLRRYMKYSIETGRLPSLLGQEFFRAKVTSYTVVTFEDRVIFVHDMEKCLGKLDEFSRQLIARHVLQEHDQVATARLLRCTERTVRRLAPLAIDQLCDILLDMGLMERIDSVPEKSCQGGEEGEIFVSDCEESENNF